MTVPDEPLAAEEERPGVAQAAPSSTAQPRLRVRCGLAGRLSLALLSAVALVFSAAFFYDYRKSRQHLLDGVGETIAGLSGAITGQLQGVLADVAAIATELAQAAEREADLKVLRGAAVDAIMDSSYGLGATVVIRFGEKADAPTGQVLDCRYARATQVTCAVTDLANANAAAIAGAAPHPSSGPFWSVDSDETGFIAVYTLPVDQPDSGRAVTVSARLALRDLAAVVDRLRLFHSGYVFLLSGEGRYLAHPEARYVMNETVFTLADRSGERNLARIGARMTQGETGFGALRSPYLNAPAHLYFTPLPDAGWAVGIVLADAELFASLEQLAGEVLLIGGGGLLLLLALIVLIVRRFTRPLLVLTEKSAAIAAGDLEAPIPKPRANDEVGVLTQSFAEMRQSLRRQLDILAETRAAQARLDGELQIARAIQASVLPRDPVALAYAGGLAVATHFQPAREVGGDLYQCFWLADGRWFLSIGDVAGKSVPAALMMAVTTTLIKAVAATVPDPAEILGRVNRELCAVNEELLFVTLFAATLAPESGELTFSNAGHNPPLVVRAAGNPEFMAVAPGLVLGVEPDYRYATTVLRLAPGDILLLYTDGVTEAMNAAGECFGTDRLLQASQLAGTATPLRLVETVVAAVAAHVQAAEPSDDLTLLAVARIGDTAASVKAQSP
jgi:phosphoserine phosphatase RsbU/P